MSIGTGKPHLPGRSPRPEPLAMKYEEVPNEPVPPFVVMTSGGGIIGPYAALDEAKAVARNNALTGWAKVYSVVPLFEVTYRLVEADL